MRTDKPSTLSSESTGLSLSADTDRAPTPVPVPSSAASAATLAPATASTPATAPQAPSLVPPEAAESRPSMDAGVTAELSAPTNESLRDKNDLASSDAMDNSKGNKDRSKGPYQSPAPAARVPALGVNDVVPPSYDAACADPADDEVPYNPAEDMHWATRVNSEGRIDVDVDLASVPTVPPSEYGGELDLDTLRSDECPPLNIVIFIVGSRGDVQPYLALALELIRTRGHRVRIATHAVFAELVQQAAARLDTPCLDHYDIGGSPEELMSYMVRNPGLVPGLSALANGDISRKRRMVKEMLVGCYLSCFSRGGDDFAADAIISNPPAFAHIHVAEALGIPLLMSFTMPWTPTTAFPHPLVAANSASDRSLNNYASFLLADALMWQGLGDLINHFRYAVLGLRPLTLTSGPLVLQRLQIPYTYAWSEHLLPKPKDWERNMDVVGFYTMDSDTEYSPDAALAAFLAAGEPPVYFGFGSVVVDKPDQLTSTPLACGADADIILNTVARTGIRALISAGWADLGADNLPPGVHVIRGNVPHDWLFARVSAVCHHGGAGTTAAGLALGAPTIVVPFFGDQWCGSACISDARFWGNAVHHAGAGPAPVPYAALTVDALAAAVGVALAPETRAAARRIGAQIRREDGVADGVRSFHSHLPLLNMRCDVDETRAALWWCEATQTRLSGRVAAVLVDERILAWRDLVPHRAVDYDSSRHYTDPFASFGQSVLNLGAMSVGSAGELFYAPARGLGGLVWGVPKASFDVVSSLQEGLENVPGMMGAHARRRGKVDSLAAGVQEGAKGLAFGLYDGLTGLVTEPYRGAVRGGVDGLVKGAFNGVVSLGPRLAGAGLGLVVHPATGAFRGLRTRLGNAGLLERSVLSGPRQAASAAAARGVSARERAEIITAWARLCAPSATEARREEHEARRAANERRLLASVRGGESPTAKAQAKEASLASLATRGSGRSGSDALSTASTREKAARWVEVHARPQGPGSETRESSATPPSASTADVAHAGTERWDSESGLGIGSGTTSTAASTVESAERRPLWKSKERKAKNRSRN
ncbi:UDP-Glycosyltransferase/glycogen phosphorylase [Cutaneotrichosporon oleaginosum]|uniref:UDP-Glycosyltransferase/glycogen phosphorylase n=1 Tax=Cutaneotrichosporon oleaginosum TaxID=879819 RepID=A0A0J0XJP3_9TREE|nr:UDP-Glycosyltransferase/glycogen phosphorylase [Cutaneotrichosporon oleaginosum]KLT41317.1 UDP-Glycosyltransferase/glycogen phosphorylase [Cutaneotrichosporon oleaginosum]TXT14067.1 hypothetical protein COLE_00260 [Cutaneotrichosporon oleaginosum]